MSRLGPKSGTYLQMSDMAILQQLRAGSGTIQPCFHVCSLLPFCCPSLRELVSSVQCRLGLDEQLFR